MSQHQSPRIEEVSWGCIRVEALSDYKDVKLFPGGAREWDWRETNTHHVPGIQPADVQELLDNGAEAIVLSRGMLKALQVCSQTLALLNEKDIPVYVLQTQAAMQKYNELRETVPVGGLFHTTC